MRNFDELSEKEVLALAIGNEEEDGRIYADFAERLRDDYPATAQSIFPRWRRRKASTGAG